MPNTVRLTALLAFLATGARATLTMAADHEARCVAVVGTNDLHGAIAPYSFTSREGGTVSMGGVVGLSGYVATLRAHYGARMVLLDGGDLFQGTLPSNLSEGRAVIDAYNLMGYTAAAIGNHEFDFGAGKNGDDRLGVIKARIAQARFPFLTLNIFDRARDARVDWPNTQPSILRDIGGIKVGILGISTPETPVVTKPENVESLRFAQPLALVRDEARALRQRGAELVVLVGHMGGKCKDMDDPSDVDSCAQRGVDAELLTLLRQLPKGAVDVAVGGHTHQFMAHWVNGTATIESGARGQYVGWVEACVAPTGGIDLRTSTIHAATQLCLQTWSDGKCSKRINGGNQVLPAMFLGKPVTPETELQSAMQPYLDDVATLGAQPVGATTPSTLSGAPLADLVAEAMRRFAHADFGLQNRGGVRAELPAGKLTFAQVFQVLPFDNNVVRVRLTGDQVTDLVRIMSRGRSGNASFAGLKVSRDGDGVRVVTSKGKPLSPDRFYTLSTSDFLVQGGDGTEAVFKKVAAEDVRDTQALMRDAFVKLLVALYPG